MRILVFSDVHGNILALEAVLEHAGPVDAYWCLGDLVGYGPDPLACVQRVQSLQPLVCLLGNHDAGVLGKLPLAWFNVEARLSLTWTRMQLTEEALNFLRDLPSMQVLPAWDVTLVHGSLRKPLEEYILTSTIAQYNLHLLETQWGAFGHTHLAMAFVEEEGEVQTWFPQESGASVRVPLRGLFNPGSVGQPRDGDPRASYAIYDTEAQTWTWYRVPYDVQEVQRRILEAGLPRRHALRLSVGR